MCFRNISDTVFEHCAFLLSEVGSCSKSAPSVYSDLTCTCIIIYLTSRKLSPSCIVGHLPLQARPKQAAKIGQIWFCYLDQICLWTERPLQIVGASCHPRPTSGTGTVHPWGPTPNFDRVNAARCGHSAKTYRKCRPWRHRLSRSASVLGPAWFHSNLWGSLGRTALSAWAPHNEHFSEH